MKILNLNNIYIPIQRRFVLLLEVIIAMLLTMILLSVLLSFYVQIGKINAAQEIEQERSFRKLYLSTRLSTILPRVVPVNNADKDFMFFTTMNNDSQTKGGTPALFFTFDNGVKLNPDFSNHVLAKLYLNQKKQLCLGIWPSPSRWTDAAIPPMKREVLFENVEDLSFSFYLPPSKPRAVVLSRRNPVFKETNLMKVESMGEWKSEWQQEYGDLPALLRVTLTMSTHSDDSIILTFPLPSSFEVIVYE